MIAPAAAEAVARTMVGQSTDLPLASFALDRFLAGHTEEGLFI
jgi:hypothetical protein